MRGWCCCLAGADERASPPLAVISAVVRCAWPLLRPAGLPHQTSTFQIGLLAGGAGQNAILIVELRGRGARRGRPQAATWTPCSRLPGPITMTSSASPRRAAGIAEGAVPRCGDAGRRCAPADGATSRHLPDAGVFLLRIQFSDSGPVGRPGREASARKADGEAHPAARPRRRHRRSGRTGALLTGRSEVRPPQLKRPLTRSAPASANADRRAFASAGRRGQPRADADDARAATGPAIQPPPNPGHKTASLLKMTASHPGRGSPSRMIVSYGDRRHDGAADDSRRTQGPSRPPHRLLRRGRAVDALYTTRGRKSSDGARCISDPHTSA